MPLSSKQRTLVSEIKEAALGCLCILEHRNLIDRIRIRFEEKKFYDIIAQCTVGSRGVGKTLDTRVVLSFQWPLWELLNDSERMETVAHETCHAVADHVWTLRGEQIESHGIEWRSLMKAVGYPAAPAESPALNYEAQRLLNRRIAEGASKNALYGRRRAVNRGG